MKRTLDTRKEINFLVNTFYEQVRQDEMLGPIFNKIIQHWPEHLDRLTDFWETNLLFTRNYKGNPIQAHSDVDRQLDNRISMEHFGRWLHLWFSTIEAHFTGTNAENAKSRARKMSTHMFLKIYESRAVI